MVDMLGDNQLDALIWSGTPPMPPVIKLKSQHDVRFLDIPRDISEKIMKVSPAYTKGDLKANVYADQPNEVKSYMLGNVLLIKADVPEEIVYQATKAVMENLDFMATVHPAWKTVQKDAIVNGFTIPVHPGALRYYREAGVAGIEEFAKRVAN
jgi:TRAP transporter TAXI family solute receptor